jgi:hypothetical protein
LCPARRNADRAPGGRHDLQNCQRTPGVGVPRRGGQAAPVDGRGWPSAAPWLALARHALPELTTESGVDRIINGQKNDERVDPQIAQIFTDCTFPDLMGQRIELICGNLRNLWMTLFRGIVFVLQQFFSLRPAKTFSAPKHNSSVNQWLQPDSVRGISGKKIQGRKMVD